MTSFEDNDVTTIMAMTVRDFVATVHQLKEENLALKQRDDARTAERDGVQRQIIALKEQHEALDVQHKKLLRDHLSVKSENDSLKDQNFILSDTLLKYSKSSRGSAEGSARMLRPQSPSRPVFINISQEQCKEVMSSIGRRLEHFLPDLHLPELRQALFKTFIEWSSKLALTADASTESAANGSEVSPRASTSGTSLAFRGRGQGEGGWQGRGRGRGEAGGWWGRGRGAGRGRGIDGGIPHQRVLAVGEVGSGDP